MRDSPRVAVRAGHTVGKSFCAACLALWFLVTHPSSKVVTTAPTWRQVEAILWSEIRGLHRRAPVRLGGILQQTHLKLGDEWWGVGFSTDVADRFQGIHAPHMLVIFDEAPGVPRKIWEAAEGLLSGEHARMLAIGNPTEPSGPFYDAFTADSAQWRTIHVSCLDHPNVVRGEIVVDGGVTREWVDGRKAAWGEGNPLYAARVVGAFPEQGESTLVPLSWLDPSPVEGAGEDEGGADRKHDGPRRLGVDVARFGADETVLLVRTESRVDEIVVMRGADTMQVTGRVKAFARERRIKPKRIFVDEIGVGSGVVDRLEEQGIEINAVNFGAGAEDAELCANVRAECYWRLRQALSPDGLDKRRLTIPDEPRFGPLRAQLTSINYSFTSKGQVQIEKKDKIKQRTGRSPDHADALALTYAPEKKLPGVW